MLTKKSMARFDKAHAYVKAMTCVLGYSATDIAAVATKERAGVFPREEFRGEKIAVSTIGRIGKIGNREQYHVSDQLLKTLKATLLRLSEEKANEIMLLVDALGGAEFKIVGHCLKQGASTTSELEDASSAAVVKSLPALFLKGHPIAPLPDETDGVVCVAGTEPAIAIMLAKTRLAMLHEVEELRRYLMEMDSETEERGGRYATKPHA